MPCPETDRAFLSAIRVRGTLSFRNGRFGAGIFTRPQGGFHCAKRNFTLHFSPRASPYRCTLPDPSPPARARISASLAAGKSPSTECLKAQAAAAKSTVC